MGCSDSKIETKIYEMEQMIKYQNERMDVLEKQVKHPQPSLPALMYSPYPINNRIPPPPYAPHIHGSIV